MHEPVQEKEEKEANLKPVDGDISAPGQYRA
jgi:hypothetical protein